SAHSEVGEEEVFNDAVAQNIELCPEWRGQPASPRNVNIQGIECARSRSEAEGCKVAPGAASQQPHGCKRHPHAEGRDLVGCDLHLRAPGPRPAHRIPKATPEVVKIGTFSVT